MNANIINEVNDVLRKRTSFNVELLKQVGIDNDTLRFYQEISSFDKSDIIELKNEFIEIFKGEEINKTEVKDRMRSYTSKAINQSIPKVLGKFATSIIQANEDKMKLFKRNILDANRNSLHEIEPAIIISNSINAYLSGDNGNKKFNDELHYFISKADITNSKLAERANLSKSSISKYLSGSDIPTRDTAIKICIGLRLSIEESNRLLKTIGYCLYDGNDRDSIIHYCLDKKFSLIDTDILLEQYRQKPLSMIN